MRTPMPLQWMEEAEARRVPDRPVDNNARAHHHARERVLIL